ncbi:hypothetical protein BWI17_16245 [Betaproteobacteria bacterium GR16-43]|nr:hypothetical protein BWI17_16245 [Betaproteobacteria bacterium GR16-43]
MTRKAEARPARKSKRAAKKAAPKRVRKPEAPRRKAKKSKAKTEVPARFVHLGDRLLALERVRAGVSSAHEAARSVGVSPTEFRKWQLEHSRERIVRLSELRQGQGSVQQALRLRARRLADLIAATERVLRDLHQDLVDSVTTTSRPVSRDRRFSK